MAKSIFKCKICNEKYTSLEGLYSHIEEEHSALIPPDMSVEQYYYYLKTGREHGSCVVCKGKTPWNPKTKKYHRFCGDPDCKAKYKETVDQRMIGKYGKVNLLNDPDHQRKMLMNRSISGHYDFDGVSKPYVGSYELDFLKTMDLFLNWDPKDIEMPSPHTYYYEYNGEKHFYIPDAFIYSLGLEIEIKDGGNNPNMHHKIQDVDKEKERLKDEVMHNQKLHHYIKLTNKNYWNLFEFFRISKEHVEKYGDYEKIPKIILDEDIGAKKISSNSRNLMKEKASEALVENMDIIEENLFISKDNMEFNIGTFGNGNNILYITGLGGSGKSTIISQYAKEYNAEALEFDAITSALIKGLENLNRNKIHPIILEYLENENPNKLNGFGDKKFTIECVKFLDWFENKVQNEDTLYIIEGMQIFLCFEPERFIGKPMVIMGTSVVKSMYRSVARVYRRSDGDIAKTFNFFINTLKRSGKFIQNDRQINDLVNVVSEGFEPDKALVWFDKPYYHEQKNNYILYNGDDNKLIIGEDDNMFNIKENFNVDKALVWFDKPFSKIVNKEITIYHGSVIDIRGKTINPLSVNVGATKISTPRWSTYFWDNKYYAIHWAITWAVQGTMNTICCYKGNDAKTIIGKNKNVTDDEFIKLILKKKPVIYVYETKVKTNKLEIGSVPSLKEYTVSEPVVITKKEKIYITKDMIDEHISFMNEKDLREYWKQLDYINHIPNVRGPILNSILSNEIDEYRTLIEDDLRNGKIKKGDDISKYRSIINKGLKDDSLGLRSPIVENYIHTVTLGLNKKMKRGLYGFADNTSYILYDDKVQLKRVNNIMQPLTENFDIDNEIEIIRFGITKDIDINLEGVNKGAYLRWNRSDELETLLEQISNEWFDSKLNVEDFIRIEDDE